MLRNIAQLNNGQYDLLVIGGGINGAAIANVASEHGLKVVLIEKDDFASGTSSKSTKLIHGGLRYLEQGEVFLVRESLKERAIQLKSAPHLVRPLRFVVPVYKADRMPLWMMKRGIFLYDFLSGRYCIQRHRILKTEEVLALLSGIKKQGLLGGVTYYDAQMDDARLCLENVLTARARGASVVNYLQAYSFLKENGKAVGVLARDSISQKIVTIRARQIVCTVGPWTNQLLRIENPSARKKIKTTKGVHIIYRKKIADDALLLQTQKDNRFFFIIPWQDHSLIGTTDTDYEGDPDNVKASDDDIDYLFSEAGRFFPDIPFQREEIVTTFAGLRPLVNPQFDEDAALSPSPSQISRKHSIEETYSGTMYVIGGKYTTYRKIAEKCVDRLLKTKIKSPSTDYLLYGSGENKEDSHAMAREYQVEDNIIEYLKSKYGMRYRDVLELSKQDTRLKEKICSCSPAIAAQVVYAIKVEMACTADDIIWRRLGIGYRACETKKCREVIQQYFPL